MCWEAGGQEEVRMLKTWRVRRASTRDTMSLGPRWVLIWIQQTDLRNQSFFHNHSNALLMMEHLCFQWLHLSFGNSKAHSVFISWANNNVHLKSGFHFTRCCNNALFHFIFKTTSSVGIFILQLQRKKMRLREVRNMQSYKTRGWTWIQVWFQIHCFLPYIRGSILNLKHMKQYNKAT